MRQCRNSSMFLDNQLHAGCLCLPCRGPGGLCNVLKPALPCPPGMVVLRLDSPVIKLKASLLIAGIEALPGLGMVIVDGIKKNASIL